MPDDVTAGRAYVKSYVEFIHYVERVYEAPTKVTHGHFDEIETTADRRRESSARPSGCCC